MHKQGKFGATWKCLEKPDKTGADKSMLKKNSQYRGVDENVT